MKTSGNANPYMKSRINKRALKNSKVTWKRDICIALRVAGNHLFPKAQKVLDVALLACMSPNILALLPGGGGGHYHTQLQNWQRQVLALISAL